MKKDTIITISRQYGSGGREIAKKLAEALSVPFYDNEIIQKAAQKSGYSKEIFEQADLKPTGSFLYTMSMFSSNAIGFDLPLSDKVFLVQSNIIKEVATQGCCVIVGRCADYVLKENQNTVNIYIHSSLDMRIERATTLYNLPTDKAKDIIIRNDKRRATYYNYYTNLKWGNANNYDLCINSGTIGIDKAVDAIKRFIDLCEKA
ncbi:MAG: cytidylate kinase-like family protein [Oscillospiraceae bacterium]